jgi:NAD(P)-dependent dehydrogenase (short-subunit alcohol dehydrogenase family)
LPRHAQEDELRLEGKVAVVTGAGRGIGRAIAIAFAREGARVAAVARSLEEVQATAELVRMAGGEAFPLRCDVSREEDVRAMAGDVVNQYGQIDILVNNAAINLPTIETADMNPDDWRRVIDVNLTGPFLCSRAVLPHMVGRHAGKIINISSIGGRRGARGRGPYRAAKAGLINFTETLAAETRRSGINVNCICPGGVDTEMIRQISRGSPTGQLMRPEEIAAVALFLASDESSAITGTSIDAFGPSNALFR